MTCQDTCREIVECARSGSEPGIHAAQHLAMCDACAERWAVERELTRGFRRIRDAVECGRTPAPGRQRLVAEFARERRRLVVRRTWIVGAGGCRGPGVNDRGVAGLELLAG